MAESRITDEQVKKFLAREPIPIGLAVKPIEIRLRKQLELQEEKQGNGKQQSVRK